MYLAGLSLLAFFVWVWSLRSILSRTGEEALATTVLAAGVLVIAVEFPSDNARARLHLRPTRRPGPRPRAPRPRAGVQLHRLVPHGAPIRYARARSVAHPIRRSWLGWPAAATALLALIAAPPSLGLDVPVSLLSFLWIAVVSVMPGLASSRSTTTSVTRR
jgi:hypothetical protein